MDNNLYSNVITCPVTGRVCENLWNCLDCAMMPTCKKINLPLGIRYKKPSQNKKCFRCKHAKAVYLGLECVLDRKGKTYHGR